MKSTVTTVHAEGQVTLSRHRSLSDVLYAVSRRPSQQASSTDGRTTGIMRRRTMSSGSVGFSWQHWLTRFMQQSKAASENADDASRAFSTCLDDYVSLQLIGSGASAKVYSATYEPRQCLVALKRIDLESIRMPCAQFEALYNEVQIMSLCQHPHVLPILSSFVSGSHLYIVTPNMAAGSCMDILHRERPLGFPEPVVACIMKQALLGLVYLHENGLIHRDVKAANLLVDACGKIKLADFGVSGQLMQGMSQRHSFVGSPCWLAPEVLLQRGYDAKVDLWSLGITCVELMRGRPPFHDARDAYAVFEHILHDPPPLGMMPQVSDQCHDFIRRCLRKRPHKRWTAREALGHPWILEAPAPDAFASLLTETGTVHTSQDNSTCRSRSSASRPPEKARQDIAATATSSIDPEIHFDFTIHDDEDKNTNGSRRPAGCDIEIVFDQDETDDDLDDNPETPHDLITHPLLPSHLLTKCNHHMRQIS